MARMPTRICTFRDLWPARAQRFPEKADWICIYVTRPGRSPIRRVVGEPGEASLEHARKIIQAVDTRRVAADSGLPLFGDYADRYLATGVKLDQIAKSTTRMQRYRVEAFALRWGGLRLDEITRVEILDWWEEYIVGQGRDPETGRRWLSALSAVYRYAAAKGVAVANPVRAFLPTVSKSQTKATRGTLEDTASPIETVEELAALDAALLELGDPDVTLLVLLMLDAGERRGEAFAARPMDMALGDSADDTKRLVWVRKNRPGGMEAEAPKSGRIRAVPMSRRLRAHLREHFRVWPQEKALSTRFQRAHGTKSDPDGAEHFGTVTFPTLAQRAGLGRRTPKDLRDTFASHLLTAGFPQLQIMRWIGHAPGSVAMFRRRYARWIGDENEWSFREPLRLAPGEVPTDVLSLHAARMQQDAARGHP